MSKSDFLGFSTPSKEFCTKKDTLLSPRLVGLMTFLKVDLIVMFIKVKWPCIKLHSMLYRKEI